GPMGGLPRVAGPVRPAALLGPFEAELGEAGRAGRGGPADRRALPGRPPASVRAVAPVSRGRMRSGWTGRPGTAPGGRVRGCFGRRSAVPGRPDAAVLRAAGGRPVRAVDVCGGGRCGADEQSWGAGAAAGGVVAAAVVRVPQCGWMSVRRAAADGGRLVTAAGAERRALP